MTEESKNILAMCALPDGFSADGQFYYGIEKENARLLPTVTALLEDRERLREALNTFKSIGDMGPEDTVMTFVEDPSVIEYARLALEKSDATTRMLLGEV